MINSFVDLQARDFQEEYLCGIYEKSRLRGRHAGNNGRRHHSLIIENTLVEKSVKNEANRMANCDNANTDRIVAAAMKTGEGRRKIQEKKVRTGFPTNSER